MDFEDKNYIIIGGSSGIGYAAAFKLAEHGAKIIIVSNDEKMLTNSVKSLPGEGHLGFFYDFEDTKNIEDIFTFCESKNIILDGMVHSAGISPLCLICDNTPELMEKVFNINVFSLIELVKYFQLSKYSVEASKIVSVASITSKGAGYRQTLYGSSKAAMLSAIKLMSKELLNRNIHINAVSPGVSDTPMLDNLKMNSANLEEKVKESQPLGIIPSQSVADIIILLLSASADYITGTEIIYDGGAMLK